LDPKQPKPKSETLFFETSPSISPSTKSSVTLLVYRIFVASHASFVQFGFTSDLFSSVDGFVMTDAELKAGFAFLHKSLPRFADSTLIVGENKEV
jgi:hypothetical protein